MKIENIIEKLDALKLQIMIEGVEEEPSDLKKYERLLDEIMGRKIPHNKWKAWEVFHPEEYATCKTIANIVQDLFHKKHGHKLWFHKDRPEIQQIIQEVVFMTKFVDQESKD